MYGLPKDFDVSVFVGKKLNLICFSVNTINFSFEKDLSITIMGSFIHMESPSSPLNKQSLPISSSRLMCIVDKVVCHAEGCKEGMLTLHFDNGHILILLDDSIDYESYIIRIGDKDIIV